MGETTKIEWTDATVSVWWGCTEVSPACANCYARTLAHRFGQPWGKGAPRERKKGADALARRLERKAVREGRRLRVFAESMGDWLDKEVPLEWLGALLGLIAETPHLDWQLLTKRPHLWRERLVAAHRHATGDMEHESEVGSWIEAWLNGKAPANVWVGTTVEDQKRADERIPALLAIPARVRFLSMEPLLEAVDLERGLAVIDSNGEPSGPRCKPDGAPSIGWIIAGGESGRRARPSHPDWFRSLRDQANEAGVAFHFKQWGEWQPAADIDVCHPIMATPVTSDRYHALPGGGGMLRIGKANAGRELDGREWDELPEVARG